MDLKKLQVKISNKEKSLFEGEAYALSSKNEIGIFDILGQHANFVTTVNEYVDVHKTESIKQRFVINRGILRVKENIVEVFVGI